jgi:hypothetical protein
MKKSILFFTTLLIAAFTSAQQSNVTFQVDMSEYTGPTFTSIELNGSFNGWCGACTPMTDMGNGIYAVTVALDNGPIEYKFTFDNWNGQETLLPGTPCTLTSGEFTNRYYEVNGDETLPVVCWESCDACGNATSGSVLFQVDMSEYAGTFTTVNLNGTFNEWCGGCASMTDDDGDMVYELMVNVPVGTIEYKFTVDGWTDQEMLTPGTFCTVTVDEFTNRVLEVTGNTTLPIVCWADCQECGALAVNEVSWITDFSAAPNPVRDGQLILKANLQTVMTYTVIISDLTGKTLIETTGSASVIDERIDVSSLKEGYYLVNIASSEGRAAERILILNQ